MLFKSIQIVRMICSVVLWQLTFLKTVMKGFMKRFSEFKLHYFNWSIFFPMLDSSVLPTSTNSAPLVVSTDLPVNHGKFIPEPFLKVTVTFPIFHNFDTKAYSYKKKHTTASSSAISHLNSWDLLNEWMLSRLGVWFLLFYSLVLKVLPWSLNMRWSLSFTFQKIA